MTAVKFFAQNFLHCLCVAALLIGSASAQERHLRAYTLQHALPEQIVPVLSAQLSAGSSVTPYHQQLILNVTDAEYRNLQTLLAQLDSDERIGVQGQIGEGAVQVQSGNAWQQHTQTRVIVNQGSTQSDRNGAQQVRAVEGMQAFISAGNTVSMRNGNYGERELVPVESGFYASARIVDDEVIIDIDQRDDRAQGHAIATQSLQTQVRGRVGEWIPLGALDTSQAGSEHTLTSYSNSVANSMSDLAIKVDLLDR